MIIARIGRTLLAANILNVCRKIAVAQCVTLQVTLSSRGKEGIWIMTIVKIVAPVTGAKHDEITLATAFQIAKLFSAYVEVLFIHRDPREAVQYSEMTLRPEIAQNMVDFELEYQRVAAQNAQHNFARAAAEYDLSIVNAPSRQPRASASYREVTGHLAAVLAGAAILSDLVVIPPVIGGGGGDMHDALVRVLTKIGRPVLLSANEKPAHIGKKIAIGWDGRDAAAKALVAALPILEKAETVEIFSVGALDADGSSLAEAREYLALHDINCVERAIELGSNSIAGALFDTAHESGCDLLVVGGYGHSRLVESIFGGVTESILSHASLPILMVH